MLVATATDGKNLLRSVNMGLFRSSYSGTLPEIPCVRFSLRRIFSRGRVDSGVFLSQEKESGWGLKKRYDTKDPSDDFLCSAE